MVFEHFPGDASEVLLAVKLADNAHDDGRHIFPSVATLAQQTRRSERTVQYQLKRMVASQWLVLVREAIGGGRGGGYGRPREYRIHPDWIRAHDARTPEAERPPWPPVLCAVPVPSKEMGAKPAPISQKKWVQPSAEMGAIAVAEMGAIAVAPEPSLTVKEPIPPVSPTGDANVGYDHVHANGLATANADSAKFPAEDSKVFDLLVQTWPARRRSRLQEARADFDRIIANGLATAAELLDSAKLQATDPVWHRHDGRYVPLLRTWLRSSRWKDGQAAPDQPAWHESREGVEVMGERLGVGRWNRVAFNAGQGESWPVYRQRVMRMAGEPPADAAAQQRQAA